MDTGWIQRTAWADSSPGSDTGLNVDSDVQHNLGLAVTELSVQLFFSPTGVDDDAVPAPLGWMHKNVDTNAVRIYTQSTGPVYQGAAGPTPLDGETGYYKIVVAPLAGIGATQERIYYDTVGQGRRVYPLTLSDLRKANRGNAPRVVGAWSDFAKSSWEVRNYTTNLSSVHSFPTDQDFVDWKNFNIPFAGPPPYFTQHIDLAPFDTIDRGIPVLTRLYGINNIYVGMRGGNNRSGLNSFRGGPNFASGAKAAVFNHFWSLGFTPAMLSTTNGRSACWTPRNHTKMYSMPKIGEWIETSQSGGAQRYCAAENSTTFSTLSTSDFMTFQDRVIVRISTNGASWDIWENFSASNAKAIRQEFFSGSNDSFFVVYKVVGGLGAPGTRQISTFWKPLGIDRLWMEYFDTTRYELEYVWWNTADFQPVRFGKVTSFNPGSGSTPYAGTGQFINKSSFVPHSQRWNSNLKHTKYSNRLRIYFRLRDLVSNKVGPLSSAHAEVVIGQTNAPVKLMIKQDVHGN